MLREDAGTRSCIGIELTVVTTPVGRVLAGEQIGHIALGVTGRYEIVLLRPTPGSSICARPGRYKWPVPCSTSIYHLRRLLGATWLR